MKRTLLFVLALIAVGLGCDPPPRSKISVSEPILEGKPVHIKYRQTASILRGVLITTLVSAAGASGQQGPENQVGAVVDAFHAALAAGDSAAALSHLADDVTILESGGVEDKEDYRSGHLAGDMRFARAVPGERGEMKISLVGEVAWAHSTSVRQGRMGDREINSQGAELVVLARENGIWKIKAIHWSSRQRR